MVKHPVVKVAAGFFAGVGLSWCSLQKADRTTGFWPWQRYYIFEAYPERRDEARRREEMMDDYVACLTATLEDTRGAPHPMAWREGKTLHIRNPAPWNHFSPEAIVTAWRRDLQQIREGALMAAKDKALADFAMTHFSKLVIQASGPEEGDRGASTVSDLSYGDRRDLNAPGRR